jgi:putative solute:sodium symporter small subunit
MVIWLVSIWFVAIFGFQFLLRIIEEPIPENTFISFQEVWEPVLEKTADSEQLRTFARSLLSVLGKAAIAPADKEVLDHAFSRAVFSLTPDAMQQELITQIGNFEATMAGSQNISDSAYVGQKNELIRELAPVVGLSVNDVRSSIIPFSLGTEIVSSLDESTAEKLPLVMGKYLIHNRSVLTDTIFLGFPFHYFYTAVFLLILFVGLCWLYCVKTDQRNAKLNIID